MTSKRTWLVIVLILLPATALASPFALFGLDAASMAMANGNMVYGRGHGVLYTNPALLSRFPAQAGLDLTLAFPRLHVRLHDRPPGTDIPLVLYDTQVQDRPLPTAELRSPRSDTEVRDMEVWLGAGLTHSLGVEGLRLAVLVLLPLPELAKVQTFYPHEEEQYFTNQVHLTRLGEQSRLFMALFGLSYAPSPLVSLGVALQANVAVLTTMDIYMPSIQADDISYSNAKMDLTGSVRPIVGLQVEPLEWLALGVTFRLWNYTRVDATGRMLLWNYRDGEGQPKRVEQDGHDWLLDYEPMTLSGGVGLRLGGWTLEAGITWSQWSRYLDHHGVSPQEAAVYDDGPADEDFAFSDTLSATAATAWRYADWAEVRAGVAYHPTPVPPQVGRTSYADNDLVGASLGHRFDFTIHERRFHIDLAMQIWAMVERTTHKDPALMKDEFPDEAKHIFDGTTLPAAQGLQTNNPGFPGYSAGGWLLVTALSLGYEL